MHQLYHACMYQAHPSIFTPIPSLSLSIKDTYNRVIANMDQLVKCEANTGPLTPLTFLNRAATAYASRTSIIYKTTVTTRFTWHQTYQRCRRLASSLSSLNITKNDVVSVLAPNVPAVYEMHFAVPMAGAILNTINTRLDAYNIATIRRHSEAKLLFVDHQLVPLARDALNCLTEDPIKPPLVVLIDALDAPRGVLLGLGELEYEQLVRNGDPAYEPLVVEDEWDSIALNYTSGTTSAPKGVVYSHRGAYLSTLSILMQWEVGCYPVYLWSLPMFHCNGWTLTWGITARGGTNVCIRGTSAGEMYRAIHDHGVTHMCCAPVLFNVLLEVRPEERTRPLALPVKILTGGAPPPAPLLKRMERLGFHVMHAYGLTEATGMALVCEWRSGWNRLPEGEQERLKARQGISALCLAGLDVKDPTTMKSVPHDGQAVGEIVLRGSTVMKGYYKDPAASSLAFNGGWYHTGDAGVVHPDGYVEVTDRLKDVIISGGENISSVQVESVLYSHPMVAEASVVAMPHKHWGETPCAFVSLKKKEEISVEMKIEEEDMISYCREKLPHFMIPRRVVFMGELPKINMKTQKFKSRELAKTLPPLRACLDVR